jgi:predicted DNA-binding transcriptional regulator AlpA
MNQTCSLQPTLLSEKEVARLLKVSVAALQRWRVKRDAGPPWIKISTLVRYPEDELSDWIANRPRHGHAVAPSSRMRPDTASIPIAMKVEQVRA